LTGQITVRWKNRIHESPDVQTGVHDDGVMVSNLVVRFPFSMVHGCTEGRWHVKYGTFTSTIVRRDGFHALNVAGESVIGGWLWQIRGHSCLNWMLNSQAGALISLWPGSFAPLFFSTIQPTKESRLSSPSL
jgi:hypothetical protein